MEMQTIDCLKKALLDTQEQVRDFMTYSDNIKDREISQFFRLCAIREGEQAQNLQKFIESHKH